MDGLFRLSVRLLIGVCFLLLCFPVSPLFISFALCRPLPFPPSPGLKFEPYHDSPLKRFLIERALSNPMNVGHYFFWHLKAEVHASHCCERFGLILEEYLTYAGRFTLELKKQASAVLKLQRIAEMVVRLKRDHGYSDPEAMKAYTAECEKLNRDFFLPQGKFQLPLDPKIEVTSLVVEKCRSAGGDEERGRGGRNTRTQRTK